MTHGGGSTFWSYGYTYSYPISTAVLSKSTDSGLTWTRHSFCEGARPTLISKIAVAPSDTAIVYAMGKFTGNNIFYKTANGGKTWTKVSISGFRGDALDMIVHAEDPSKIVAGSTTGLYYSANGGSSWSKISTDFTTARDIYQSDVFGGLVVASEKGIWIWHNWFGELEYYGEDPSIADVDCVLESHGYLFAGTRGAAVWSSRREAGINEVVSLDETFVRVLPNPVCNGSATIQFNMQQPARTTVTVYDLFGRAVMTVLSQDLADGIHDIYFDSSSLLPGVYFTVVQNNEASKSTKFVVSR